MKYSFIIYILFIFILSNCTSQNHDRTMAGYDLPKTRPDDLSSREIIMSYPYNQERFSGVYYHDGHYDTAAMKTINYLFRDRHANVTSTIDPELIDYLVDIRTRLGLPPDIVFEILSGYRTPETNASLSQSNRNVAKESLHVHGWAVDFRIPSVDGRAICEIAKTMQRGGVAYYPKDNHVHVDLGNIRTWQQR